MTQSDDELVVKSVWKSAHAVEDWPGKVTIRRFSPYRKVKIEGEGKTLDEAVQVMYDGEKQMENERDLYRGLVEDLLMRQGTHLNAPHNPWKEE